MSWFNNMKINTKFNLIMSFLLIILFLVAALLTYNRQRQLILRIAADNGRLLASQIVETRDYMSDVVRGEPERNYALVPQVVATQVAKRITRESKYYVRQVSTRYRNPQNRPDAFETAQLDRFAENGTKEVFGVIKSDGTKTFRYMQSMIATQSCLQCHGTFDSAPKFVQERFPRGHFSYNYRPGEVIGAVSVSIPMNDLYRQIGVDLAFDLIVRGLIFLFVIFVMGALIRRTIIYPIEALSGTISRVTETGDFSVRIPTNSSDEVGHLIRSFNDMMEELGHKTLQHSESEERYRKFIEMARSAVVSFLEDGKIVISNEPAEKLFRMSKQDLLGESIYAFVEDGEALREIVSSHLRKGPSAGMGTTIHRVRDREGRVSVVEVALSSSMTGQKAIFTAILRETEKK